MDMFDIFIWLNLFKSTTHQESLCREKLGIQRKSSNFAAVLVSGGWHTKKVCPKKKKNSLTKTRTNINNKITNNSINYDESVRDSLHLNSRFV